jgi:hypothetical protein
MSRTRPEYTPEVATRNDLQARSREASLKRLDQLADLLDSRFKLFGFRFGLDGIASIVPVAGDVLAAIVSLYLIAEAGRHGANKRTIAKMLVNVGIDTLFGSIPVLGTIFDIAFKANNRNVRILREQLTKEGPAS